MMSVRFNQSCPTCGRRVEVRASLLGHTVACQHCGGEFVAADDDSRDVAMVQQELMRRVDLVLQRSVEATPTTT